MSGQRTLRLQGQISGQENKIQMMMQSQPITNKQVTPSQLPNGSQSFYHKRHRTSFNQYQLQLLEESFKLNSYPSAQMRDSLATKTQLDASRIQVWFQNRRAKRKKQLNQMNQVIRLASGGHHHNQLHHQLSRGQCHRATGSSVQSVELGSLALASSTVGHCAAFQQQMALDLHLASGNNNSTSNNHIGQHQPPTGSQYSHLCQASGPAAGLIIQGPTPRQLCVSAGNPTNLSDMAATDDSSAVPEARHWLGSSNMATSASTSTSPEPGHRQMHQHQSQSHNQNEPLLFSNVMIRSSSLAEVRELPQTQHLATGQQTARGSSFHSHEHEQNGQQPTNWSVWT